jgi:hypothetical protein
MRNLVLAVALVVATAAPTVARDVHKAHVRHTPGYNYQLPTPADNGCDVANKASMTLCTNGG